MSLIRPSLAIDMITTKSPMVFVQDEVPDGVPNEGDVPDEVCKNKLRFCPVHTKRKLVSWNHKNMLNYTQNHHKKESHIPCMNHSDLTQNLFKNSSKQENAYTYSAKKDLINVIKLIISRAQQQA
jgi:hypothetical protein